MISKTKVRITKVIFGIFIYSCIGMVMLWTNTENWLIIQDGGTRALPFPMAPIWIASFIGFISMAIKSCHCPHCEYSDFFWLLTVMFSGFKQPFYCPRCGKEIKFK